MKKTNDLTLGAMFGAIYGVLLLLIRYLFPSTDSFIYYLIPLPIAIYTFWRGWRSGLVLLVVLILLGFLIFIGNMIPFFGPFISAILVSKSI